MMKSNDSLKGPSKSKVFLFIKLYTCIYLYILKEGLYEGAIFVRNGCNMLQGIKRNTDLND